MERLQQTSHDDRGKISGTYRIFPIDDAVLDPGKSYALRIKKEVRDYWVEFRQGIKENLQAMNGVILRRSPWSVTADTLNSGSRLRAVSLVGFLPLFGFCRDIRKMA